MSAICQHLAHIIHIIPDTKHVCPECVALGDAWVHLRTCQECGHVGCCDDSKNKQRHQALLRHAAPRHCLCPARRAVALVLRGRANAGVLGPQ
ncbi:hypothetical protein [Hymenobacter nivis]|uniref:hypothetical protein n=1 Tax=Hymenobacter nivis TaxID=1850093 RepID=UPI001FE7410F|nr:hypothetical protein [Hymenobacter nivis]